MLRRSLSLLALSFALNRAPCAADTAFEQGVSLYQQKDYRHALTMFSQALSDNNSPTVLYYAALCYQQLGDNAHAKQYFKIVCDNFAQSKEAELAAQGLKQLQQAPPQVAAVTTVTRDTAPAKASDTKSGDILAGEDPVEKALRNTVLSDEEWQSIPDQVKVPFTRATSGHLFVNGYVNGRPLRMMFDTGAEPCVFGKGDLQSAGVKVDDSGAKLSLSGVAGSTPGRLMNAEVAVGDIKRRIPIVVTPTSVGMPVLGESFFKDFKYNIDTAGGFIEFTKKPRTGQVSHIYESTDLIKIPFNAVNNSIVVQAKINGKKFPMIFDTGAFSICLSALHAAALGIQIPSDAQRVVSMGAGGVIPGYAFKIDRIELGPIIKTQVPIIVNAGMTPPMPLLGQPFFKDRQFTIDNDNHTINFVH